MTDHMTPGQRLAELRRNAGLTQAALAKMSGVNTIYISQIETGFRAVGGISLRRALKLADALGVENLRDLLPDYDK